MTSAALVLVLAADARACPWVVTTILPPAPKEEPAPVAPESSEEERTPCVVGSTLPDEAPPRGATIPERTNPVRLRPADQSDLLNVLAGLVLQLCDCDDPAGGRVQICAHHLRVRCADPWRLPSRRDPCISTSLPALAPPMA